uniref:non-specific serine/threonine protein kinase n=2 Tax=Ascaris TaxID=6251 RepID=A0A0M3I067_ASCLU
MAENSTALPPENTEHSQFGRNAPPYLEIGCVVCGKYRVDKMVGGGGFGQVYSVVDERSGATLAMKIESERHEPARLVLEYRVLSALQGTPHIPYFFACGSFRNFNYIVMELLGENLSELRRQQRKHRLSVATVTRVSKQCCNALKAIHDIGFIHRDVKPSNLCIGLRDRSRVVHLIDFGIARQYRHHSGIVRKERQYAGFRGTMRYVSLTVHERREQGPVDDLWSLFYSIVELIEGTLPWRNLPEPDTIALCKQKTSFNELGRLLPPEMEKLFHYLETLQYHHFPDYSLILDILQSSEPPGTTENEPYDWEKRMKKTKPRRSTNHKR